MELGKKFSELNGGKYFRNLICFDVGMYIVSVSQRNQCEVIETKYCIIRVLRRNSFLGRCFSVTLEVRQPAVK
jgi:hypothetical protein